MQRNNLVSKKIRQKTCENTLNLISTWLNPGCKHASGVPKALWRQFQKSIIWTLLFKEHSEIIMNPCHKCTTLPEHCRVYSLRKHVTKLTSRELPKSGFTDVQALEMQGLLLLRSNFILQFNGFTLTDEATILSMCSLSAFWTSKFDNYRNTIRYTMSTYESPDRYACTRLFR